MSEFLAVFTSPQGESETLEAYHAVQDHWPRPFTELDITTGFGQTHIIANGEETAPPVVFLHAYFATAMAWYRTVGPLSRHYRTYAVDVIGEANKSRPTRPITSLEDSLEWFTELIDALEIGEFYLAGNSFGAFLSTFFAMHMPHRIRKLVLIGPAATFRGMLPFYVNLFAPKAMYLFFPWLPGQKKMMRRTVDWMHAGLPPDPLWEPLFYQVMLHGATRVQVFPRVFSQAEFAQVRASTLLMLGDRERIYPPEDASQQAIRLMPSIQVQIIPHAHHITALAQPELVNAKLETFFGQGRGETAPAVRAKDREFEQTESRTFA